MNTDTACELLKPLEAAKLLRVGREKIYALCNSGAIPSVRLGERGLRVPLDGLRAWVKANSEGGDSGTSAAA